MTEEARCERCGWTLAESADKGCVPGNCSYRCDCNGAPHRPGCLLYRDPKDARIAQLEAEVKELRDHDCESYWVKARVYGAIAAEYQKALQAFADRGEEIAKAALEWRHSEQGGVPLVAMKHIGTLLDMRDRVRQLEAAMDPEQRVYAKCYEAMGGPVPPVGPPLHVKIRLMREALEKADALCDYLLDEALYPMNYSGGLRVVTTDYQAARAKVAR